MRQSTTKLSDFEDSVFAPLIACWRAMGGDAVERDPNARLPDRANLTPEMLKPILANIHFLEWVDPPEDLRYRLVGPEETERLGHQWLGTNYLDHLDPAGAVFCRQHLYRLNRYPCATLITSEEFGHDGRVRGSRYLTLPIESRESGRLQVMSQVETRDELNVLAPDVVGTLGWQDRLLSLEGIDIGRGVPDDVPPYFVEPEVIPAANDRR